MATKSKIRTPKKHETFAFLIGANYAGMQEPFGTVITSAADGHYVSYGFNDAYGFNRLGTAIVSRAKKWNKFDSGGLPNFEVQRGL